MKASVLKFGVSLGLVFALAGLPQPAPALAQSPATGPSAAPPAPELAQVPGVNYVHVASSDNLANNWTYLDHPLLNGNEDAVFFVTQNWNPKNLRGTYNDETISARYDHYLSRWAIINQNLTPMADEAAFNVHIPIDDSTVFVHETTSSNTVLNYTLISNPLLDNKPDATFFVTQNWDPYGEPRQNNQHHVGVWYSGTQRKWSIFNQDKEAMPLGAAFNIHVASLDETTIVHTATLANTTDHATAIDDPRINGNPNALLTVTQNWNPGGVGDTYNDHSIGVWYWRGTWYIFNQDGAPMPGNASFNVLIPPTESAAFTHVATAANSVQQNTYLDHPLLNGNPDAIALATQNWNPGGVGEVYNNHHIGLWYSSSAQRWAVFNQDRAHMPEGAAFNIYVPPIGANAFTHVASAANSEDNVTYIHHPESNGDPNGIAFITQNWNPRGLTGTYNDHATGIWYSDREQKASVFNEDIAPMPAKAAFNVFIPGDADVVFTHTTAAANTTSHLTYLDHPILNHNPEALVYVTHNWNPGGGLAGVHNDEEVGVWYSSGADKWSVSNQSRAPMPLGVVFNVMVVGDYRVYLPLVSK